MKQLTFGAALNEAIIEEMASDASVVVIGPNVTLGGFGGVTKNLLSKFGSERVIDTPLGEDNTAGIALGLALSGAKCVAELSGPYLLRAIDTIANEIAMTDFMYASQYPNSLVLRADIGYKKGSNPQLNQSYESMLASIPGLTVVYPSNPNDARGLMKSAIRSKGPVMFLENKSFYDIAANVIEDTSFTVPLGKADVKLEGDDITLITYGPTTWACLEVANKASEQGISCEVIDLRTINPIDIDTVAASISKTGKAVVVHQAHKTGGLGAEIVASIVESEAFDFLEQPIVRVAAEDIPIGYSEELYRASVANVYDIYCAVQQVTC